MKEKKAGASICNEFTVNKHTSKRTMQQFQVRTFIFIISFMDSLLWCYLYYSMRLLWKNMKINVNSERKVPENKYSKQTMFVSSLLTVLHRKDLDFSIFRQLRRKVAIMISIFLIKSTVLSEGAEISTFKHQTPPLLNFHHVNSTVAPALLVVNKNSETSEHSHCKYCTMNHFVMIISLKDNWHIGKFNKS